MVTLSLFAHLLLRARHAAVRLVAGLNVSVALDNASPSTADPRGGRRVARQSTDCCRAWMLHRYQVAIGVDSTLLIGVRRSTPSEAMLTTSENRARRSTHRSCGRVYHQPPTG